MNQCGEIVNNYIRDYVHKNLVQILCKKLYVINNMRIAERTTHVLYKPFVDIKSFTYVQSSKYEFETCKSR